MKSASCMPPEEHAILADQASSSPRPATASSCATPPSGRGAAPPSRPRRWSSNRSWTRDAADRLICPGPSSPSAMGARHDVCLRGRTHRAFTQIFPASGRVPPGDPQPRHLPARAFRKRGKTTEFLNTDPMTLRWSDVVNQIVAQDPGVPLSIWADEDCADLARGAAIRRRLRARHRAGGCRRLLAGIMT